MNIRTHHTYPQESAGRLMTTRVPVISSTTLIADIEKELLRRASDFDTIDYLYVVNGSGVLVGVLSIRELFRAERTDTVSSRMTRALITVRPHTDQERVAFIALKHNIKAVPVVDGDGHFLGTVSSDDILRVLDHEASENLARFGGVVHHAGLDTALSLPIMVSVRHRLPWLLIGLAGGLSAAGIIAHFEALIAEYIILAAFIPLVVYLAGVVGTQVTTLLIRDLAVHQTVRFLPYLIRQSIVVAIIGFSLSAILAVASFILYRDIALSIVLATAVFVASLSAILTSLILPFFLSWVRIDPANASGPLSIIAQDILSIVIYFSVAVRVLQ